MEAQFKRAFLWIAVLPGAVLGAILVNFIAKIITEYWQDDGGWKWLHSAYFYLTYAFLSFVFPIAFSVIGMKIAPKYKRETGVFLIAIMIVYGIFIISIYIFYSHAWPTIKSDVFFVFHILGCLLSFSYLPKNDNEFETN